MRKLVLATTAALLALSMMNPVSAAVGKPGFFTDTSSTIVERRRPRVPGGSGCDSPRDIREHPECTPA